MSVDQTVAQYNDGSRTPLVSPSLSRKQIQKESKAKAEEVHTRNQPNKIILQPAQSFDRFLPAEEDDFPLEQQKLEKNQELVAEFRDLLAERRTY